MASFTVSTIALRAAAPGRKASRRSVSVRAAANPRLKEILPVGAIAPFEDGLDPFGLSNTDDNNLKRYREAELQHGRLCMLASVGFLVGEQVEGSSFLFDAQVTGPAINHFQQVPTAFWLALGLVIALLESNRVQVGWAYPGSTDRLFMLKEDYVPGDIGFDPLGLQPPDEETLNDLKEKELANGRLAMIAATGMVGQELATGINILPADEVLELEELKEIPKGSLQALESTCAGAPDEAACAKAFEVAEEAAKVALGFMDPSHMVGMMHHF